MEKYKHPEDICAHLGDDYDRYLGAIVPPIFQNSLFTRKRESFGYSYSRINNPTIEILEKKLAALEHAQAARVFSSGMAAITATLTSLLKAGDHAVVLRCAYYPVCRFFLDELEKFGIQVDFVEHGTPEEFEAAIRPNTTLFYLESPSSNIFRIQDLRAIAAVAKRHEIVTVIDNTWATPLYQNPLDLGIDYVVHSATKYLGGHSDIIMGAVMGSQAHMDQIRNGERAFWGSIPDPFSAWLLTRSLRTLEIRMRRHSENANAVAHFLEKDSRVKKVYYPGLTSHEGHETALSQMRGFSGLMSFILDADEERSMRFVKNLKGFEEGPSWGGFESVMNTPGLNSDPKVREFECIPQGLIRISVGLESQDLLLSALEKALKEL
jgi:cystathionine beta-lyase/cystathionine gamma-synthase